MSKKFPKLTLILGGANSGKSAFAEKLVISSGMYKNYIATAQAFDDEMKKKIDKHQKDRGGNWNTIEAPLDILPLPKKGIVLIDCLTLWLSNNLLEDKDINTENFINACLDANHVVCVSNETGLGVVPDNYLARKFRTAQGQLNQQVAAQSDLVVQVIAGIPLVLKGELPENIS